LKGWFFHPQDRTPRPDGKLLYGKLIDGPEVIDDVLVSVEDVTEHEQAVEISCHGSVRVVQRILEILVRAGSVVDTDPMNAVFHWPVQNKIEEEAIEALLQSKTQRAARYAAKLRAELPPAIRELAELWKKNHYQASLVMSELMRGFGSATALLRGITVALIGPPNSGKSTLFNLLLGRQAVVTSPVPGTTRDWVMESIEIQGVPVNLVDTAGRRETDSELEKLAIEAGDSLLDRCSALLFVFDGSSPAPESMFSLLATTKQRRWVVANKSDLGLCWTASDLAAIYQACGSHPLQVSAETQTGCELLKHTLLDHFGLFNPAGPPLSFFTDRQAELTIKLSNRENPPSPYLVALLGDRLAEATAKAL
jgi:tRNA modification GTPase